MLYECLTLCICINDLVDACASMPDLVTMHQSVASCIWMNTLSYEYARITCCLVPMHQYLVL